MMVDRFSFSIGIRKTWSYPTVAVGVEVGDGVGVLLTVGLGVGVGEALGVAVSAPAADANADCAPARAVCAEDTADCACAIAADAPGLVDEPAAEATPADRTPTIAPANIHMLRCGRTGRAWRMRASIWTNDDYSG